MWLSRRERPEELKQEALAEDGQVTLEETVGVYAEGERRNLPVYGPGGYRWRPCADQQVLVLKLGRQGEQPCVAGAAVGETELAPGEIEVFSNGAKIVLHNSGRVDIWGNLFINGQPYSPCRC